MIRIRLIMSLSKSSLKRKGYALKSWKGYALLFFSLHPDATTDTSSLHGSFPAIEGEKWSATKWSHVKSFDKPIRPAEQGEFAYENPICTQWAAAGECKKNPLYMLTGLRRFAGEGFELVGVLVGGVTLLGETSLGLGIVLFL